MTEQIPSIEAFPLDGRTWRVDWFGAVERNYEVPSELSIQVIISPLVTKPDGLASSQSVIHAQRQSIKIGVGQLPLIRIGSLWKNGELLGERAGREQGFEDLSVSPQTVRLIRADHKVGGEPLIPPNYHNVGPDGLWAHCLAVEHEGDPFGIIIPAVEVIRFYYANSTDLAHATFAGDFQYSPSSVVMLEDSYYDKNEGICLLRLRSNFDDEDAWTIGRIFHSPVAMKGVRRIHNSLKRRSINREFPLFPETVFPFDAKTSILTRVKSIKSCGAWRYLVFALEHCTGPFPFDHLIGDRENRNISVESIDGDENDDVDDRDDQPGPRLQGKTTRHDGKGKIQNRQEPSRHLGIKRIVASEHQFGAVSNIRYEKFIPTENKHSGRGRKLSDIIAEPVDQYGTGRGTYSENKTGGVRFVSDWEERDARPMPESLVRFVKVVEELNQVAGCSAVIRPPSVATQFVPLNKASRFWQWSYLNSTEKIRRQVVIADASVDGKSFSMVEFEWRAGESYKLALLAGENDGYLNDGVIGMALSEMAKVEGRWEKVMNDAFPQVEIQTAKHVWESGKKLAVTVKKK